MKKCKWILLFLLLHLLVNMNIYCDDIISITGLYSNRFFIIKPQDILVDGETLKTYPFGIDYNQCRLSLALKPVDFFYFYTTYNMILCIENPDFLSYVFLNTTGSADMYRIIDFDKRLYPEESSSINDFIIRHNLNLIYICLQLDVIETTVGRQAISWGSARVVNPLNIFSAFSFFTDDSEASYGIDAIRTILFTGVLSEIDLGYVFGKNLEFDKSAAFIRTKFFIFDTDISLLSILFYGNILFGLDMATSFLGLGAWLEMAAVFTDIYNPGEKNAENDYFCLSSGIDYTSGDFYFFIEYHFNSAGSVNSDEYLLNLNKPAYTDGNVYLLGQHYIIANIDYQVNTYLSVGIKTIFNANDPSLLIYPCFKYVFTDNVELKGGSYINLGETASMDTMGFPVFNSEFGTYPYIAFINFYIYF